MKLLKKSGGIENVAGMRITQSVLLFACLVGVGFPAIAQEKAATAREIVDLIQAKTGVPSRAETVDTFKAGNPEAAVKGIAVTMMATLDVLRRAAAAGDNLVITHEPTFYDHTDKPTLKQDDAVWAEKRTFIEQHGLVVWRFHDYWHERNPDGIEEGIIRALGWKEFQSAGNPYFFAIPPTTVGDLASELRTQLNTGPLRVLGKQDMRVTKVAFSPGASGFGNEVGALQSDQVQVLIVGETREWETVEYVDDAVTEGKSKALIILNHIPSEQAGMEECARWLKTFLKNVRVDFIPTKQPFWSPELTPRTKK